MSLVGGSKKGHFVVMAEGDCNKQANRSLLCGRQINTTKWPCRKIRAGAKRPGAGGSLLHALLYEARHLRANNNCENKFINYDNSYELL